jgi:hypothetical protein
MTYNTTTKVVTNVIPTALELGAQEAGLQVPFDSVTDGITAQHTSPSQTTAVLLTTRYNRIATVTTADDAVRLPPAIAGLTITVSNASANAAGVYPSSAAQGGVTGGDNINALSANAYYAQATGKITYVCYTTGTWQTA